MNESDLGEDFGKKLREDIAAGVEFQREDNRDPVRGPIMEMVHSVSAAARYDRGPLGEAFKSFLDLFERSVVNYGHYRLYHVIKGTPPGGNATEFDAEGEWSIATKMEELAQRYHIDIGEV